MPAEPIDNLPLIPDRVVDRLRKGKDVPLEEISPAAAEMAADREASRSAPLHMGALKPVSKARAAELMTGSPDGKIQRGTLPRAPVTRRVIPEPFQRPSISVQVPWEPRPEWGYCRADEVRERDIIPDLGRVVHTYRYTRHADAADQVPVFREERVVGEPVHPLVPVQDYTGEDARRLLAEYGSTQVAIGVSIRIEGAGGKVLNLDAGEQVRVFRIQSEGGSGVGYPVRDG